MPAVRVLELSFAFPSGVETTVEVASQSLLEVVKVDLERRWPKIDFHFTELYYRTRQLAWNKKVSDQMLDHRSRIVVGFRVVVPSTANDVTLDGRCQVSKETDEERIEQHRQLVDPYVGKKDDVGLSQIDEGEEKYDSSSCKSSHSGNDVIVDEVGYVSEEPDEESIAQYEQLTDAFVDKEPSGMDQEDVAVPASEASSEQNVDYESYRSMHEDYVGPQTSEKAEEEMEFHSLHDQMKKDFVGEQKQSGIYNSESGFTSETGDVSLDSLPRRVAPYSSGIQADGKEDSPAIASSVGPSGARSDEQHNE